MKEGRPVGIRIASMNQVDEKRMQKLSELKVIVRKAANFDSGTTDAEIYPLLCEISTFIIEISKKETFLYQQACKFRSLLSNCVRCSFKYSETNWEDLRAFCEKRNE